MGTAMQNLDRLLAMPYGCGEQNMVLFAPNIFILQYLTKTLQLTPEIQSKAKRFLESGEGSGSLVCFCYFPVLTAFVVKSFSKAHPYIFIDGDQLSQSLTWLKDHRKRNGCFQSVGKLFNNAMKVPPGQTCTLFQCRATALYYNSPNTLPAEIHFFLVYTQALLAYTFTLSNNTELREMLLAKLEEKAVRKGTELVSSEVELTSYVLLALLSGPNKDLGKASEIVNWLSKQQNPHGGFSSTQDTVVALQALAEYAEATFSDKGDVTVTVTSKTGFHQQFHVDQTNRLLLQKASLPDIPGEYSLSATGSGCVYVQNESHGCFSSCRYTGSREKSNMALVEVKMLSGFTPDKKSIDQVSDCPAEQGYLGRHPVNFSFMVEQEVLVKNLRPAIVKVYDYYEPGKELLSN
uniref:Alpha-macroglobulin receptor-binding domain-containing protein n=1 Tax=Xenopus tropicalis TaxID=8364 RepID=F7C6C7_XENTR